MVAYIFNQIINQTVTFIPGTDTIAFTSNSAADIEFAYTGDLSEQLSATTALGTAVFDSTNDTIEFTTVGVFALNDVTFSNGSLLAVGDLTHDDTLDSGANTLDFSTDASLISALHKNNQVWGRGGADTITLSASSGNQKIYGGQDSDTISAGSGNNTVYGGDSFADTSDGGDTIVVGSGNNLIYANAGADAISFSSQTAAGNGATIYAGAGADTVTANNSHGSFFVHGGTDNDELNLTNLYYQSTIYGGDGADSVDLSGGSGDVTVYGGNSFADTADGADAMTLGGGNALVYANAGADAIEVNHAVGKTATLYLGSEGDTVTAGLTSGTTVIYGNSGADDINLTNNSGDATIYGGNGAIDTEDGGDTIVGSIGSNLIYANAGSDAITVRTGVNQSATVYGGAGNDSVGAAPTSSAADITLYGNTDTDAFDLNFTNGQPLIRVKDYEQDEIINVTLSGGNAASLTLTRGTDTLIRYTTNEQILLEGFTGTFDSTSFVISDGSVLITNFGEESAGLTGTDFSDQLIAGDEGDTLTAGAGADRLTGGDSADIFVFATANIGQADIVVGGGGNDTISLETPGTTIVDTAFSNMSGVEVLELSSGDFSTNGFNIGATAAAAGIFSVDATGASSVTGDMDGVTHGMLYRGGSGDDSIRGGNHDDAIDTKDGDDTIIGNRGNDTIISGDGEDIFSYEEGTQDGVDAIMDIDFGTNGTTVDQIQFNATVAGFKLGNNDTIVDGAIITNIERGGANGTEIIILKSIGIATADITSSLDIINGDVDTADGSVSLFFDTTKGYGVMYYDGNGGASGGHTLLAELKNITSLSDMNNIDFGDFSLTI